MALSFKEQQNLWQIHRREYDSLRKQKKVEVLGVYNGQARKVIDFVKNIPDDKWNNRNLLTKELAKVSIASDQYNEEITPVLLESELQLAQQANLQNSQVAQIEIQTKIPEYAVLSNMQQPNGFDVTESIWTDTNNAQAFNVVLSNYETSSQGEVSEMLEDYYMNPSTGGGYYIAERVVDTEFVKNYSDSKSFTMFEYNRALIGLEVYYERSLSFFHRVADVCDDLAGRYSIREGYPFVPSHPNCACSVNMRLGPPGLKTKNTNMIGSISGKKISNISKNDLDRAGLTTGGLIKKSTVSSANATLESLSTMQEPMRSQMMRSVLSSLDPDDPLTPSVLRTAETLYGVSP